MLIAITSLPAIANENIAQENNQLLFASCQTLTDTPEHKNAKHCIHFIQGFLTAAKALDPLIIKKQSAKSIKSVAFMSRSYYQRNNHSPTTPSLLFCIPNSESEASVISVISKLLPSQMYTKKMLGNILLTTLKTQYPCEKV
jgi:hypothetical protein